MKLDADAWTAQMLAAQEHLARLQRLGAPAKERRDAGLRVGRLKRLRPPGAPADPLKQEEGDPEAAIECLEMAAAHMGLSFGEFIATLQGWRPEEAPEQEPEEAPAPPPFPAAQEQET